MIQLWKTLPRELLQIILKYDGRIKYKNGRYFNINRIDVNDNRYNIIREIILKKTDILAEMTINNNRFYFEFMFDSFGGDAGLYYCFNDTFEISYFYEKDDILEEIRTVYQ